MATQQFMAILVRVGDTILWLPPDSEDLVPAELNVKKIHYHDPVDGKIRIETDGGDIKVSSRSPIHVKVKWSGRTANHEAGQGNRPVREPRRAARRG